MIPKIGLYHSLDLSKYYVFISSIMNVKEDTRYHNESIAEHQQHESKALEIRDTNPALELRQLHAIS